MASKVILTESFKKDAKKIAKKHKSIGNDIKLVIEKLEDDPYLGDRIGVQSYKIRFAIKSKGRGKSGGGRLITYINISAESKIENDQIYIYLVAVYDKSVVSMIPDKDINERISSEIITEEE
jgi:mRNA-degrading endonuclease RelE of RelBE toxin-antitoxin system